MNNFLQTEETRQCHIAFPGTLNDHETVFGGLIMKWMDEVAYITATRFTRNKMVTVSVDSLRFLKPIQQGMIVELIGRVIYVGKVKLEVQVEIFSEDMFSEHREKTCEGKFIFAATDEQNRPQRIS
ncbi:MAG: acyl-CoA thioesterase [Salinivirgaceae bacterium]